jgi:hypothetical protein
MSVVLMMKVGSHRVVEMVTVGDPLVPARGPMPVTDLVLAALMRRRTRRRIRGSHGHLMLVYMSCVNVVQMAVVQVVGVPVVLDGGMPAALAVGVLVLRVGLACHGGLLE